jgi:hypothetical protein
MIAQFMELVVCSNLHVVSIISCSAALTHSANSAMSYISR